MDKRFKINKYTDENGNEVIETWEEIITMKLVNKKVIRQRVIEETVQMDADGQIVSSSASPAPVVDPALDPTVDRSVELVPFVPAPASPLVLVEYLWCAVAVLGAVLIYILV